VREALEGALSPSITSAVLFEALDSHGSAIPRSRDELLAMIRGPLAEALGRRLDASQAESVLLRIEELLDEEDETAPVPRTTSAADPRPRAEPSPRERDATTAVPTAREPVSVVVLAAGNAFAHRLGTALGPRRVTARTTADPARLGERRPTPAIVVVDATDFAAVEPRAVASALRDLPGTTVRLVWGSELPYGRSVTAALFRAGVEHTTCDRNEGIDPLVDLVRSRHRME